MLRNAFNKKCFERRLETIFSGLFLSWRSVMSKCGEGRVKGPPATPWMETCFLGVCSSVANFCVPPLCFVLGWLGSWFRWVPTSMSALQNAEKRVLSYMKSFYTGRYVDIGNHVGNKENRIWTLLLNEQNNNTPLVLIHGFASGVGLWVLNLDSFSKNRPVYAIDILGFGRSSRPKFSSDAQEAEKQIVDSIEEWRRQMKLDKFILLGHSMGGFLAASYSLCYPERVRHLILADPWGFPEHPGSQQIRQLPMWVKAITTVLQPFNPLAGLRAAGPWGPRLVEKLRPDIKQKFSIVTEDDREAIPNYIYHCNAQTPSGEAAFKAMTEHFGWAKWPMAKRLEQLNTDVNVTFLYGSRSWIDQQPGHQIRRTRPSQFSLHVIQGAGHHVYADQPAAFNQLVQKICNKADGLPVDVIDQSDVPRDIVENAASVENENTTTTMAPEKLITGEKPEAAVRSIPD